MIANENFTDSISMVQVFEIRDVQTVNFVAACKQAYLAQKESISGEDEVSNIE